MLYASVVPIGKLMLTLLVQHAVAGCNESQIDLLHVSCWLLDGLFLICMTHIFMTGCLLL